MPRPLAAEKTGIMLGHSAIAALAEEVNALCRGAQIQRIIDRRAGGIALALRSPGTTRHLEIVANANRHAFFLSLERPERCEELSPFARALRKHLQDNRIENIEVTAGDRILTLHTRGSGAGTSLVAEWLGRNANLFLLGAEGKILAAANQAGARSGLRPGAAYLPPSAPPSYADPSQRAQLGEELLALPSDGSRSEYFAKRFIVAERSERKNELRNQLSRSIGTALRKRKRLLAALREDLAATEETELTRHRAEALIALGKPKLRGLKEVQAVDYHDPECPQIEIPIDARLSVGENAERLFQRAKKLERGRPILEKRLCEKRAEVAGLEELQASIDAAEDLTRLEELRGEVAQTLPSARPKGRAERAAPQVRQPFRKYQSAAGKEILVGKGSRDNDELTCRIARGSDLWLHAEGMAGAHVILRLGKGEEPDNESLLDAATLAVHFSRASKSGEGEVLVTRAAHVRKPKGIGPGRVIATQTKAIWVRVEAERITRLLASPSP